jgi:hypothetical protein
MIAFNVLSPPVAGWIPCDPPVVTPLPAQATKPAEPDWRDYAGRELWREAIIAFLRTDRRKCFKMWDVLNKIVGESCQRSRFDTRAATFEALGELMQLRRERAIYRHRRRWIAILDLETPLLPID